MGRARESDGRGIAMNRDEWAVISDGMNVYEMKRERGKEGKRERGKEREKERERECVCMRLCLLRWKRNWNGDNELGR